MYDPFKLTTILTSEVKDDTITIKTMMDGIHEKYWSDIFNTKEKMIRNGLVGLGWATPGTKNELLEALKYSLKCLQQTDIGTAHLAPAIAAIARAEGEKP